MEPLPDADAVSSDYSFTDTRYLDKSTNTNQSRTLGIVRTSETNGYYVDIYRSDNSISNDYVYHNIGDNVTFLNETGEVLKTAEAKYPVTEKDYPGFRFYTDVRNLKNYSGNLTARFAVKDDQQNESFMQALIAGNEGQTYYQAYSLKTKTAAQYNGKPLPLFTIRTESEAKSKPFIVVFEPFSGRNGQTVERISVEKRSDSGTFTALTVFCKNAAKQEIYQSIDPEETFISGAGRFCGYYGVVGFTGNKLTSLYLGKGSEIANGGYSLKSTVADGSANLSIEGKTYKISCNQETEVGLPLPKVKKAYLQFGTIRNELQITKTAKEILIKVQAIKSGTLVFE
jgi:hypothetical protein